MQKRSAWSAGRVCAVMVEGGTVAAGCLRAITASVRGVPDWVLQNGRSSGFHTNRYFTGFDMSAADRTPSPEKQRTSLLPEPWSAESSPPVSPSEFHCRLQCVSYLTSLEAGKSWSTSIELRYRCGRT